MLDGDEPIIATMTSDVDIDMHDFENVESGGVAFNVVAEIPGTDPDAQAMLIAAHYDAFYRSALDNTGAAAQLMTIAKAMMRSGTRFERSVIFLASCGEEYGYADTEYSYLAGAWWAATVTHASTAADPHERWTGPDGRLGLFLNLEESPQIGAPLTAAATPDLMPWIVSLGQEWDGALLPNGFVKHEPYSVWQDGATFTFAGISTVVTVAEQEDYQANQNHTTADDVALIDYAYLDNLVKFYGRVLVSASTGIAPHDLSPGRAAGLPRARSAAGRARSRPFDRDDADGCLGSLSGSDSGVRAAKGRHPPGALVRGESPIERDPVALASEPLRDRCV
ncbi:hypothetical protein GCM10010460_06290 [Microbacterium terrae]|nr:hypothetical protein GCM10017594_03870 [Microbacterium terrae]